MALTFFGVAWCVLAGVTNHPIQVSGSVLQHVVPGGDRENRNKNIKRNRGEAEVTVRSTGVSYRDPPCLGDILYIDSALDKVKILCH